MLHEGGKAGGSRLPRSTVAEPVDNAESFPRYAVTAHPVARTACIGCGYWGKKVARNLAALNALHAVADLSPAALAETSNEYAVPGVPVKAIDTTGEGDTFAGGFLSALHRNWTFPEAARLANAASSSRPTTEPARCVSSAVE